MGVSYTIRSDSHPDLFEDVVHLEPVHGNLRVANVREAWYHINWQPVMDFLGVEFRPLYEPENPYLSTSMIIRIRDRLKQMTEDDAEEVASMRNDAAALLDYFNFYVAHNAYIVRE